MQVADQLAAYRGTLTALGSGWVLNESDLTKNNGIVTANFILTKNAAFGNNETILTLPAGFRPVSNSGCAAWQGTGGTPGACGLQLGDDGTVTVTGQTGSNTQVRMSLAFRAAQ